MTHFPMRCPQFIPVNKGDFSDIQKGAGFRGTQVNHVPNKHTQQQIFHVMKIFIVTKLLLMLNKKKGNNNF